eukprot:Amastigsp_a1822_86.p4 type:complete len:141 gc:universal Amastigsp_a1822_86:558-136(-)
MNRTTTTSPTCLTMRARRGSLEHAESSNSLVPAAPSATSAMSAFCEVFEVRSQSSSPNSESRGALDTMNPDVVAAAGVGDGGGNTEPVAQFDEQATENSMPRGSGELCATTQLARAFDMVVDQPVVADDSAMVVPVPSEN